MFKRVEKRMKRKAEEEALGLDEDLKGILGMHDTDSDESSSESDSDDDRDVEKSAVGGKRKRGWEEDGNDDRNGECSEDENTCVVEDGNEVEEEGEQGYESDDDDDEPNNGKELSITIGEALKDPICIVSLGPQHRVCVVCPGKELKNQEAFDSHRNSKGHKARFKRFANAAAKMDETGDALELVRDLKKRAAISSDIKDKKSRRAEKRKAKLEVIALLRKKHKDMKIKRQAKVRAERDAKTLGLDPDVAAGRRAPEPPKKKQKTGTKQAKEPKPPKDKKLKVKDPRLLSKPNLSKRSQKKALAKLSKKGKDITADNRPVLNIYD